MARSKQTKKDITKNMIKQYTIVNNQDKQR
jgi:hypothetical protein